MFYLKLIKKFYFSILNICFSFLNYKIKIPSKKEFGYKVKTRISLISGL